jgi:hypothetical protein
MTRTFAVCTALAISTVLSSLGCCNVGGLRDARSKPQPDNPRYTIEEQKRRARDKYAIPDSDVRIAPPTGSELPGGIGR